MTEHDGQEPRDAQFDEVDPAPARSEERLSIEDLRKVRLMLSADLGQASMLVRDILDLKRGSVVPLEKLAGEMTDIYVNGVPLAKGEVVVIADALHVRIADIIGASELEGQGDA